MQSGMRRHQAKSSPAFVYIRCGSAFKTTDIMAPVSKSGHRKGKSSTKAFFHGYIVRPAVTTPVYREFLTADSCGTCEQNSLSFASLALQKIEYSFVVKIGVIVVHFFRIRAVCIDTVGRDSLTKICLETVNTHVEKDFQFVLEPLAGFRICEVNQSHSRLPHIPLPYVTVRSFDKVSVCFSFCKKCRFLCNIWIDPYADVESFCLDPAEHSLRIREYTGIPQEV